MRNSKPAILIFTTIVISFVALLSSKNAFGQSEKIYVVINEATWCKYCKAHGERVNALINDFSKGKEIVIIHRDVTDKNTIEKTNSLLKPLGVYEYMNSHKEAAMVYVFNSKTKKVMDGFKLKSENEEILTILKRNLEKAQ